MATRLVENLMSRNRSAYLLAIVLSCWTASALSDDGFKFSPPEIRDCSQVGKLGFLLSTESCLLVYSYVRVDVGLDSAAGLLFNHEGHVRLAGLVETDAGPVSAVLTISSQRDLFWGEYNDVDVDFDFGGDVNWDAGGNVGWGLTSAVPRVDELYLGIGDKERLRVGEMRSVLDVGDYDPLGEGIRLLGGPTWSFEPQPWLYLSQKGYSPSIQAQAPLADNWTASLAMEDLNKGLGTIAAVMVYDDGSSRADASIVRFHKTDQGAVWGMHLGADMKVGVVEFVGEGTADSLGHWHILASTALPVGPVELAGTIQWLNGGHSIAGTVTTDVSRSLSLSLSGELAEFEDESISYFGARGKFSISEEWEASLEVGQISDSWNPSLQYGKVGVEWQPSGGLSAKLNSTFNDIGAYKVEASMQQVLQ